MIVFNYTIPVLSFLGAWLAFGWSWLTPRMPARKPLFSGFSYSRPNNTLNWSLVCPSYHVHDHAPTAGLLGTTRPV